MKRPRTQAKLGLSHSQIHTPNNNIYSQSSKKSIPTAPIHFPKGSLREGEHVFQKCQNLSQFFNDSEQKQIQPSWSGSTKLSQKIGSCLLREFLNPRTIARRQELKVGFPSFLSKDNQAQYFLNIPNEPEADWKISTPCTAQ